MQPDGKKGERYRKRKRKSGEREKKRNRKRSVVFSFVSFSLLCRFLSLVVFSFYRDVVISKKWCTHDVQGGEDSEDASNCRSFFAKEPLIIGLFRGKWLVRIRHPMTLRHPVRGGCRREDMPVSCSILGNPPKHTRTHTQRCHHLKEKTEQTMLFSHSTEMSFSLFTEMSFSHKMASLTSRLRKCHLWCREKTRCSFGVATISRLLQFRCLICRIRSLS